MKKFVIIFAIILCVLGIAYFTMNSSSPKFSRGNPGRRTPPLKSAGNLFPKSLFCSNTTEYTLITATNVLPDQVCILDLSGQNYSMIPEDVFKYQNLSALILNNNPITSLAGINKLSHLTDLEVGNARLQEVPNEVGELKSLQVLQLYRNQIESIPAGVGKLNELRSLNLSGNKINSFSEEINKLTKLEWLELRGNQLTSQERKRLIKLLPQTDIQFEYEEGL